jgi:hypothetical protein
LGALEVNDAGFRELAAEFGLVIQSSEVGTDHSDGEGLGITGVTDDEDGSLFIKQTNGANTVYLIEKLMPIL